MKPFMHVTFGSGHVYQVPTQVVAQSHAKHYEGEFDSLELSLADTVAAFGANEKMAADWAQNNMNWSELEPHAFLVNYVAQPKEWGEAYIELSDHPRMPLPTPAGIGDVFNLTVEMLFNSMSISGDVCSLLAVTNDRGEAVAGIVVLQGGPAVISGFVGALQGHVKTMQQALADATAH